MGKNVVEAWICIEKWLESNAPKVLDTLQPGTTASEISYVEDLLKVNFPESLKVSYQIHNGQVEKSQGLIDDWSLLPLDEILSQWNFWMDLSEAGEAPWHPLWIPITHDGGGNHYCLDLHPNLEEKTGRIIYLFHETLPNIEEEIADSFEDFLSDFSDRLENNFYVFSEEEDKLVEVDYL
ncbi:MAG: SMI1/KNR4 family protein [Leptolyngbyaceae cyanobacterium]